MLTCVIRSTVIATPVSSIGLKFTRDGLLRRFVSKEFPIPGARNARFIGWIPAEFDPPFPPILSSVTAIRSASFRVSRLEFAI